MENATRALVMAYAAHVAQLNGVPDAMQAFTATPSTTQKLWKKVQESSAFLKLVNFYGVPEMTGELIGMGLTGLITRRTDTSSNDRLGADPSTLDNRLYQLAFTEFDVSIKWSKLDMWAKFPNFQTMWADVIAAQIALELIMVGWNGTSVATASNPGSNTLLQDINKGWLQKMREENTGRVLADGADTGTGFTSKITYGTSTTADYVTLDALVYDAYQTLLPTWARDDTGLVAICNGSMLHDKYLPVINRDQDAQNYLASDIIMANKRIGRLPAMQVPHFPTGKLLITRPDNLSVYYQEDKHRRHMRDNPARSRFEDFQSDNLAYVIEDLDYAVLIENIAEHNVEDDA